MSSHAGSARRATRLTTLYVATWGILATAAVAYLIVLAFRPDVSGIVTRIAPAPSEPTQAQRTVSKALAELQSVRQSVIEVWTQVGALKDTVSKQEDQSQAVAALSQDVTELKSAIAGQDERGRQFAARLAAVESRHASDDGASSQVRAAVESPAPSTGRSREFAGATITGSVDERARRTPTEARAAGLEQQSHEQAREKAAAAAPDFGAPKVIAAVQKTPAVASPVGLQLATAPTTDDLRLAWLRISSTNGDALQELEPRFVEVKIASGVVYRLIAGPVESSQEGARMCAKLKANKVRCVVAPYTGEPL